MSSTTPPSAPTLRLVPPPLSSELACPPAAVRDRRVKFVLQKIHEDLAQTPTVKELAQEAGVNPDYLERLFHAEMEQTITHYIQQARLEAACELLATSFLRIGKIAAKVGYQKASYFAEVFQAHYGLTPTAYRQQAEKNAGRKFHVGKVIGMSDLL
jgi:transcriptional regulator GlxA family with amidase domain